MATAWYICPYKRSDRGTMRRRYCAMNDFTAQIRADGGDWSESEVLGGVAVVKVRASAATLTDINDGSGFVRLPKNMLTESLSDLTTQQKNAIINKLENMGYDISEIQEHLGTDVGSKTLADVLRFAARRRLKPRYDEATDQIICDGPEQWVRSIDQVNDVITE